jgi:hypothetical protein
MQADNVYLDDYYRYHEFSVKYNHPTYPNMNGFVVEKPQAVVYDGGTDEPTNRRRGCSLTASSSMHNFPLLPSICQRRRS